MDRAQTLLLQLSYLRRDGRDGAIRSETSDPATTCNRLALLALAGQLERVFRLPCREAPDAFFIGGEIAPADFGLVSPDGPLVSLGGRGTTLRAAFEGCMGEGAEYLSMLAWGDERFVQATPAEELAREAGPRNARAEEDLTWMLAGMGVEPGEATRPLDWLPAKALDGDKQIHVPTDLCLRRLRDRDDVAPRPAESSGCAAGSTLEQAQLRALLELVERDAAALWWYGGQPAGTLDLGGDQASELGAFMADLRGRASRPHWFLDLTSDLGIPVVAALSSDPDGGAVVMGFAADPDPLAAARAAALEMCQMELAQDLVRLKLDQRGAEALNAADKRHLERMRRLCADAYPQLSPNDKAKHPAADDYAPVAAPLSRCLDAVRRAGFEAYGVDLTRPEVDIPVARVLVPGLQSAKPGWVTERLKRASGRRCRDPEDWLSVPPLI